MLDREDNVVDVRRLLRHDDTNGLLAAADAMACQMDGDPSSQREDADLKRSQREC
jgi:hypothetical protein